ncbi:hypothetical protein [Tepidibacter mesophilus]|uniref:hypothetical protein n=1 Tax=Tepidibacter mesophilus TaxID=655607 RepID=UPI000C078459|nr:hypothetical protein [Tepidibacter mesophilus]
MKNENKLYENFMSEVINLKNDMSIKTPVEVFFKELTNSVRKNSLESIVMNNNEVLQDCYELLNRELCFINQYKYSYFDNKIKKQDIIHAKNVLNKLVDIINKSLEDINIIIVFLLVISYFDIDFSDLISKSDFDESQIKVVSTKLKNLLGNLQLKVSKYDDLPYSERQFIDEYIIGLEENNINKVYNLIDALERGRDIYFGGINNRLIEFLYFIDYDALIDIIKCKEKPVDIKFYLSSLNLEEQLKLGLDDRINNKWILFEVIRQILSEYKNKEMPENYIEKIANILERISIVEEQFFIQSLTYYKKFIDFHKALGITLSRLDKSFIEIYANSIEVTQYKHSIEDNKQFLIYLDKYSIGSDKVNLFCKIIYEKWEQLNEKVLTEGQYLNEILYSSCLNSVITYLIVELKDVDEAHRKLEDAINNLLKSRYVWKDNFSVETTHFFIYITKLYFLSIVFRENNFVFTDRRDLKKKMDGYLLDERTWILYFRSNQIPQIITEIYDCLSIERTF